MNKKLPGEYKQKYYDEWENLTDSVKIEENFDLIENLKTPQTNTNYRNKTGEPSKTMYESSRKRGNFANTNSFHRNTAHIEDRPFLICFSCGQQSFISAKCPTCFPINDVVLTEFRSIKLLSISAHKYESSLQKVRTKGMKGIARSVLVLRTL